MDTQKKWRTTAAYISGALCGNTWLPNAEFAGLPGHWNVRSVRASTIRETLANVVAEYGGDFQGQARFSADTVLRVERRVIDGPGKYRLHIWEREVSKFAPEMVASDAFVSDFIAV